MKTIIACTDFSPSSTNACMYAGMLAQKLNCKLVIFNLFTAPVLHSNSGLYGISYKELKKDSEESTGKVIAEILAQYPGVNIKPFTRAGAFDEELENFIAKHRIAAVVMGLETKNKISKFIWGSHGVNIAGKINAPAIIVPEKYKTHALSSILLAVDNADKLQSDTLKEIEQFSKSLKTGLKLLHVRTPDEILSSMLSVSKNKKLKNQEIESFKSKTIEDGIRFYVRDNAVDLVAIISRKHSVFYNLFRESVTKRVAFSAKVPVMALHE